jgi:hypothetical protein
LIKNQQKKQRAPKRKENQQKEATKENAREGIKILRDSGLKSKYETRIAHYFEMTAREEDSEGQILCDSCLYS